MGRKRGTHSAFVGDLQERAKDTQATTRLPTSAEIESRLIPSSAKSYRTIVRLWTDFSATVLHVACKDEVPFPHAPSVEHVKLFLQWLVRCSVGLIEDKMTDVTLGNYLSVLKRAVKDHINYQYSKAQNQVLAAYIEFDLPRTEQLSTRSYKKPIAPLAVTRDLVRFLLVCDEYESHSRIVVQLVFSLLLLTFMGSRPGEVIESEAWKDSNEGLLYGDVVLMRQEDSTYTGFALQVCLRNRKGHRSNGKYAPRIVLYEERNDRALCPVTWFLAQALADRAFEDAESIDEMESKEIPPGATRYTFRYRSGKETLPIMRGVCPNGTISDKNIWNYNCFSNQIKSLGQRAGYEDRLSAYCFRRGYANAIQGSVRDIHRQQLMRHTNNKIMQSYMSSVVGIDTQSVVHSRPQQTNFIESHTSMMSGRQLLAPKPPGAQLIDPSIRNKFGFTAKSTDLPHQSIAVADLSPTQQYELRRQSRKRMYHKQRETFFKDGTRDPSPVELSTCLTRSPSRYLQALLKHEPDRQQAALLLYPDAFSATVNDEDFLDNSCSPTSTASSSNDRRNTICLKNLVEPLTRLARPARARYAYQDAEPTQDHRCSVCKDILKLTRPERMNRHLLKCARRKRVEDAEARMAQQFREHPVCLWNDCCHRFTGKGSRYHITHITDHLRQNLSRQCLWSGCYDVMNSLEGLCYHVSSKHGIPTEYTTHTFMQYCYEHNMWTQSERVWTYHLKHHHLTPLNDYCGLIRRGGVVLVAAYCLFCLGNTQETLHLRFAQYSDIFELHKHMKTHTAQLNALPTVCPHPLCEDFLESEAGFWEHANSVHGIAPFGPQRFNRKRKTPENGHEDADVLD